MIRLAREYARVPGNVTYPEADFLAGGPLPEGGYDCVSAVAVVHHAPFGEAVTRLARLTAPGGRLVRQGVHRLLPGCAFRRTLLWRHVVVRDEPGDKPREGGP